MTPLDSPSFVATGELPSPLTMRPTSAGDERGSKPSRGKEEKSDKRMAVP